uniref:Uncharacterized protein n=1 Tax=Anguilla anguilla TaxID=7936 RepID=A0A0E9U7G9_ANGAN
MTHRGLRSLFM